MTKRINQIDQYALMDVPSILKQHTSELATKPFI